MSRIAADRRAVLALLLLALALRVVCLERSVLIGADSMRFLAAARHFENGDAWQALRDPYHPLLSLLTAGIDTAQNAVLGTPSGFEADRGRRERAAQAVVLALGLLFVWAQIDLARRLLPAVPAWAVGLLAACQPYFVRSSADIMSDTPMLAMLFLALRDAAVTAQSGRNAAAARTGAAVGLAYLARPEGLVALPAILPFWLVHGSRHWRARLAHCGLLVLTCSLVALPYASSISILAGEPTLTLKKDVYEMLGVDGEEGGSREDPGDAAAPGGEEADATSSRLAYFAGAPGPPAAQDPGRSPLFPLAALWKIFVRWLGTAPQPIAVGFAIGLALAVRRRRTERQPGHLLYASCAACMVGVLWVLLLSVGDTHYLVRRHVFVLVALSLPLAATGLLALGSWLGARVAPSGARRGAVALLALVAAVGAVRGVSAQRTDQLAQREAAHWIARHYGRGEQVFTDREKVAYYAGGVRQPLLPYESLREAAGRFDRAWVAFYRERVRCCPRLEAHLEAPGSGFRRVRSFAETGADPERTLLLYLWERGGGAPR